MKFNGRIVIIEINCMDMYVSMLAFIKFGEHDVKRSWKTLMKIRGVFIAENEY